MNDDHITAAEYQEFMQTGRMPARMMQPKESKYHNKRTMLDGKMRASIHETNRYAELRLMEKAKEVTRFFEQIAFQLPGNIASIADFVILWPDGRYTVEDAKGVRTDVYKIKKKLMKATYGIDIVEV